MAIVPGSCGELAQGIFNGSDILITCPISWYSKIEIDFSRPDPVDEKQNYKSYQAVRALLAEYKLEQDFTLKINSQLPRGKGMASSSADIAAALAAAGSALALDVSAQEIREIALAIEPTDGVFLPGITAFDHIKGTVCEELGEPPKIRLAVFDFGGEVDTIAFNKRDDLTEMRLQKKDQFMEAYDLVKEGIATKNPVLIAKGATISALANQVILPKPDLEKIILIGNTYGALGVNVAHSGTVAGIMFAADVADGAFDSCMHKILSDCPQLKYLGSAELVSGGIF